MNGNKNDHHGNLVTTTGSSSSSKTSREHYMQYYRRDEKPSSTQIKSFAVERLMKDLREIKRTPLKTIIAEPLEDNIFEWHCNLIGTDGTDYNGACFHLIFTFPQNYPFNAPDVRLVTPIQRSHVYGEWICLDMLESWGGFSQKAATGWSTAYSVLGILLQLQAFLFEPEPISYPSIRNAVFNASKFQCKSCPHDMSANKPWPFDPQTMERPLSLEECFEAYPEKAKNTAYFIETKKSLEVRQRYKELARNNEELRMKMLQDQVKSNLSKLKQRTYFHFNHSSQHKKNSILSEQNRIIPGLNEDLKKIVSSTAKNMKKKNKKKNEKLDESSKQKNVDQHDSNSKEIPDPSTFVPTEDDKRILRIWNTYLNPLATPFQFNLSKTSTSSSKVCTKNSNNDPMQLSNNEEIQKQGESCQKYDNLKEAICDFPQDILFTIFTFLQYEDIKRCEGINKHWRAASKSPYFWERNQIVCFHSKRTFEEDIIGIGVTLKLHPKTKQVQYVSTSMDLICHTAFYDLKVRRSVYQLDFTHFIPLYVNSHHGKRAMKVLKHSAPAIMETTHFSPILLIDMFAKLMNTQVVEVMNGSTYASIKALQGYCFFHRMIIAIVQEYPGTLDWINEHLRKFIQNEEDRMKKNTPSLGDLLPLLSISKYKWKDIAGPILHEVFDRNALWILKANPHLATLPSDVRKDKDRLKKSFEASKVSLRLIMFHVYFLTHIARPNNEQTLENMAQQYDSRYGLPPHELQEQLQKAVFDIQSVNNYNDFFVHVQLPAPSSPLITLNLLRQAVLNSEKKKYHSKWSVMPKKPVKKLNPKEKSKPRLVYDDDDDDYNYR